MTRSRSDAARSTGPTSNGRLDPELAVGWVASWDRQQEAYAVGREERFAVVAEVVATVVAARPAPVVVDLGCGPGSLALRVARRIPRARVIGIDTDPLLLALGRAASPEVDLVEGVVAAPGWTGALPRPLDAVVSSTALHYLRPDDLLGVYTDLAALVRPGGVLVNADHLPADDAVLETLARDVSRRPRYDAEPPLDAATAWSSWWDAVAAEPLLQDLLDERRRRPQVTDDHPLSAATHSRLLRESGFRHCGVVWQDGPSTVLVAVR
ncbi:class I SAM-dependent methyltransferase [Actinotalea sp. K2]|uniref:class I SAM-dependent methyltransferase n=1 Tax=Actinotalea sp. K2 TaxID=2939438 RepID=UPI002016DA1B|nr:class I SAM-dependent methyltransferase [Actinotalea sp. K2]MCL3859634.1 class I SAM-dependent methyltransferase [Actinotalea sp. K2]